MNQVERKIFKESLKDAIKGILLRQRNLHVNDYTKLQNYSDMLARLERGVQYV